MKARHNNFNTLERVLAWFEEHFADVLSWTVEQVPHYSKVNWATRRSTLWGILVDLNENAQVRVTLERHHSGTGRFMLWVDGETVSNLPALKLWLEDAIANQPIAVLEADSAHATAAVGAG